MIPSVAFSSTPWESCLSTINPMKSCETPQKYDAIYHESTKTIWPKHPAVPDEQRTAGNLAEKGEFSRFDLHEACWEYLHSNVHQSLCSDNPLLVSLAVLNAKVGRTRLAQLVQEKQHPLPRALLLLRMEAEGLSRPADTENNPGESQSRRISPNAPKKDQEGDRNEST